MDCHGHFMALGAEGVVSKERTGIVNEDVDVVEGRCQPLGKTPGGPEVSEIRLFADCCAASLFDFGADTSKPFSVPADGDHGAAERAQLKGCLSPKAGGGSGDHHHSPWSPRWRAPMAEPPPEDRSDPRETSYDRRLKRIVDEQALDISMLKDLQKGKW